MSDEPNSKRRKMNNKGQYQSQYHSKPRNFLEPGVRGFLATCNFNEKECVRECYNLLNEYADQLENENEAAIASDKVESKSTFDDSGTAADEPDEEDISTLLENEINSIKTAQRTGEHRFQQIETKVKNCVFIRTTVPDPNALGVYIMRNLAETKQRKTRMLLRFLPVDAVCKANIEDIKNAAGKLFDKVFLNTEPTTFSVIVNKRFNNSIDRMHIIQGLAELIDFKSTAHKVDLKTPKVSVVCEIVKGHCCISILPDYFKLKKYNVHELVQPNEEKGEAAKKGADMQTKEDNPEAKKEKAMVAESLVNEATSDEATTEANAPDGSSDAKNKSSSE